jgi:hypothetical protein
MTPGVSKSLTRSGGGIRHVWVGAKKRAAKSNKETGMKEVKNAVK